MIVKTFLFLNRVFLSPISTGKLLTFFQSLVIIKNPLKLESNVYGGGDVVGLGTFFEVMLGFMRDLESILK
jgi:hypothetical protein